MSKLEKEWNLQGWSTRKPDSLAVFYFGLGREGMVSSGVAHFYESPLEMTFKPSRISETTLTSVKYLKRHFFNHPACFFLEQATDDRKIYILFFVLRYPVQCTSLELIPQSLQNKICNRLHPKCTPFACFPIICSPAIWKLLFSRNRSNLCYFWYLEGRWLNVISAFWRQLLLRVGYSLVHSMKAYVLIYPKRFMWCCANFGYEIKM